MALALRASAGWRSRWCSARRRRASSTTLPPWCCRSAVLTARHPGFRQTPQSNAPHSWQGSPWARHPRRRPALAAYYPWQVEAAAVVAAAVAVAAVAAVAPVAAAAAAELVLALLLLVAAATREGSTRRHRHSWGHRTGWRRRTRRSRPTAAGPGRTTSRPHLRPCWWDAIRASRVATPSGR